MKLEQKMWRKAYLLELKKSLELLCVKVISRKFYKAEQNLFLYNRIIRFIIKFIIRFSNTDVIKAEMSNLIRLDL